MHSRWVKKFLIVMFLGGPATSISGNARLVERPLLSSKVIQVFTFEPHRLDPQGHENAALVLADIELKAGRIGPTLLWVPELGQSLAYVINTEDAKGADPLSGLHFLSNSHRGPDSWLKKYESLASQGAWADTDFATLMNTPPDNRVNVHNGFGTAVQELVLHFDGGTLVKPSRKPEMYLHQKRDPTSGIPERRPLKFIAQDNDGSATAIYKSAARSLVVGASRVFTPALPAENAVHAFAFQGKDQSGQQKKLLLLLEQENGLWHGVAIPHHARLKEIFEFKYDPMFQEYRIGNIGIRQFDPDPAYPAHDFTLNHWRLPSAQLAGAVALSDLKFQHILFIPVTDIGNALNEFQKAVENGSSTPNGGVDPAERMSDFFSARVNRLNQSFNPAIEASSSPMRLYPQNTAQQTGGGSACDSALASGVPAVTPTGLPMPPAHVPFHGHFGSSGIPNVP